MLGMFCFAFCLRLCIRIGNIVMLSRFNTSFSGIGGTGGSGELVNGFRIVVVLCNCLLERVLKSWGP